MYQHKESYDTAGKQAGGNSSWYLRG